MIRELEFLQPLALSFLGQHRRIGPYGAAGGREGLAGRQRIIRANGDVIELKEIDGCEVSEGDRFVLETPGGGGWGPPDEEQP